MGCVGGVVGSGLVGSTWGVRRNGSLRSLGEGRSVVSSRCVRGSVGSLGECGGIEMTTVTT